MRASHVLHTRPEGLYCPAGDFYIDPARPVERALITHGHADHARPGHRKVLATAQTLDIMRLRYGENFAGSAQAADYGEQIKAGDLRSDIAAAALDQLMCARAGAVFLWTAVFARSVWKYRERAYRYFYLDAGHMAAQLSLAAVAQGLGSCPIAAFYDDEVNTLLGIDAETEGIVYMTAVGRPSRPFGNKADQRHTARPKE